MFVFQSEASTCEAIVQVQSKMPKAQEDAVSSEINTMVSKGTRARSRKQSIHHLPLYYPQEKWDESLHNESEASKAVYYLYKVLRLSH